MEVQRIGLSLDYIHLTYGLDSAGMASMSSTSTLQQKIMERANALFRACLVKAYTASRREQRILVMHDFHYEVLKW